MALTNPVAGQLSADFATTHDVFGINCGDSCCADGEFLNKNWLTYVLLT